MVGPNVQAGDSVSEANVAYDGPTSPAVVRFTPRTVSGGPPVVVDGVVAAEPSLEVGTGPLLPRGLGPLEVGVIDGQLETKPVRVRDVERGAVPVIGEAVASFLGGDLIP